MKNFISLRAIVLIAGLLLSTNFAFAAITARGSDSTLPIIKALADAFEKKFGTLIVVNGGGSGVGAKAVLAGEVQLAFLSRVLDSKEKAGGLVGKAYARDAAAVTATLATKGEATGQLKAFIEFARSSEGQEIVTQNGLLAVN